MINYRYAHMLLPGEDNSGREMFGNRMEQQKQH